MGPRWRAVTRALEDAAPVVLAWVAALLLENVAVGVAARQELATAWEAAQMKRVVVPLAIAALAPLSLVAVALWRLAEAGRGDGRARLALLALGGAASLALGLGVTEGRHFASWSVRAPAVLVLATMGAALAAGGAPRVASLGARPGVLAALGATLGLAGWLTDAHVLPRLYPAFHVAALIATLVGTALVGVALGRAARLERRGRAAAATGVWLLVAAAALYAPRAARSLAPLGNLRRVLVERGPLLGRTVELAARRRDDDDGYGGGATSPAVAALAPGEVARALDWTGHDLVLVSVDALRADHVSAYGYGRATTPHLDALAAEGVRFDAAYCPTPHTSYSVTSMMTGKYLRPLLALGVGEDSETWAQDLRLYGWRTAAFYPPAVFFIDEDRFGRFEREHLGFEYAKVEFADPALRERQVRETLDAEPPGRPLFLWVHFFEPHEPYVVHPEHVFSPAGPSTDVDAYDSEVATADDGIGAVVALVRARRPGAIVVVTADHGEEFGEHGGRYHGTTVYEEQVRVPLVVVGPGVRRGSRVADVVQTIDLLPTALSALGIPRPPRVRGRDLGALLAGKPAGPPAGGFAFTETDDYALVASGAERLVCARRAASCALYRPGEDPGERRDVSGTAPARFAELRDALRAVEREAGRYEANAGAAWPEALKRGMVGDADAALDVAALLDDADVGIRRKAAEVCFSLRVPATLPAVRRAAEHDEDATVGRWAALARARLGEASPVADAMLTDADVTWRRPAALAAGARGDGRACDTIATWWASLAPTREAADAGDGEPPRLALDLPRTRDLLEATSAARCKGAVPGLLAALADVRARPYVADALGALGDDRARGPLRDLLASEGYVTTLPHEARALLALGARDWAPQGAPAAEARLSLPVPAGPARVVALLSDGSARLEGSVDGAALVGPGEGEARAVDLPAGHARRLVIDLEASAGGVVALWALARHAPD